MIILTQVISNTMDRSIRVQSNLKLIILYPLDYGPAILQILFV